MKFVCGEISTDESKTAKHRNAGKVRIPEMIQERSNPPETLRRLWALAERTTSVPERELALQRAHSLQIKYEACQNSSYEELARTAVKYGFTDDERPLRGTHYFYRKGHIADLEISEWSQEWVIVRNGEVRDRGSSIGTLQNTLTELGFSLGTSPRFRARG
jgi:hypothetical protein